MGIFDTFEDIGRGVLDAVDVFGVQENIAKRKANKAQRRVAEQQEDISAELFAQSGPLRDALLGTFRDDEEGGVEGGLFSSFLETGELPEFLQTSFASSRDAIEAQFANSDEAILSRIGARGGQLRDLRARNLFERNQAVGDLELAELPTRQALLADALGIAQGFPATALSGLASSGGLQANLGAQNPGGDLLKTLAGTGGTLGLAKAFGF